MLPPGEDQGIEHVDRLRHAGPRNDIAAAVEDVQRDGRGEGVAHGALLPERRRVPERGAVPVAPLPYDQLHLGRREEGVAVHGAVALQLLPDQAGLLPQHLLQLHAAIEDAVPAVAVEFLLPQPAVAEVPVVKMQIHPVDRGEAVLLQSPQEVPRPAHPFPGLVAVRAAGDELELRAHHAPVRAGMGKAGHGAGIFPVLVGVALSRVGPAAAPALVADAPVFHVEGLRAAVGGPLRRQRRGLGAVAVFRPLHHLVHAAPQHVDVDPGLRADLPTEVDELMGAEAVVLRVPGGKIGVPDPLALRADPVAPVVHIRVAAAGPAQKRRF